MLSNVGSGGGAAAAPAAGGAVAGGGDAAEEAKEEEKEEGTLRGSRALQLRRELFELTEFPLQRRKSRTRTWVSVFSTKATTPRRFSFSLYFNCMAWGFLQSIHHKGRRHDILLPGQE
jgi:hypothetical protein